MFNLRRTLLFALLLIPVFTIGGIAQSPKGLAARRAQLRDALEQEWQYTLRTSPELATSIGDPRYNDRWGDYSAAEQERQIEHAREEIRVFEAIDTAGFSEQEVLDKTLMLRQLREAVEGARFKSWEMPVDQMNGIQLGIPGLMTQMPLKTVKDYENYVTRLHGIPRVLDQVTADMRQGMADHLMPPRYLLDKVAAQSADIATKPLTSSPFAEPLQKFPSDMSQADRGRLTHRDSGVDPQRSGSGVCEVCRFCEERIRTAGTDRSWRVGAAGRGRTLSLRGARADHHRPDAGADSCDGREAGSRD